MTKQNVFFTDEKSSKLNQQRNTQNDRFYAVNKADIFLLKIGSQAFNIFEKCHDFNRCLEVREDIGLLRSLILTKIVRFTISFTSNLFARVS